MPIHSIDNHQRDCEHLLAGAKHCVDDRPQENCQQVAVCWVASAGSRNSILVKLMYAQKASTDKEPGQPPLEEIYVRPQTQ